MSRTYRKSIRYYTKYKGIIYNTDGDKTLKGKARQYPVEIPSGFYAFDGKFRNSIWDGSIYPCKVLVGDSESHASYVGRPHKSLFHRIDRARQKQALIRDLKGDIEDATDDCGYPAFDPWSWD